MRIVPSTDSDYAYIEWDSEEQKWIDELQRMILRFLPDIKPPKGLQIEISEHDLIPENIRRSLIEGRFFLVE